VAYLIDLSHRLAPFRAEPAVQMLDERIGLLVSQTKLGGVTFSWSTSLTLTSPPARLNQSDGGAECDAHRFPR
jgi:hypothetical protein